MHGCYLDLPDTSQLATRSHRDPTHLGIHLTVRIAGFQHPHHCIFSLLITVVLTLLAASMQIDKDEVLGMLSIRDVVKVVVGEHREQMSQMREYISGSY